MDSILMYSGGVDSLLCLQWLVDNGYDPVIVHVRHGRLTDAHERRIRRNSRRIHTTDAYYVFKTDRWCYEAFFNPNDMDYCVRRGKVGEYWNFHEYRLPVCLGYWKRDNKSQETFIKDISVYGPERYILPIKDMKNGEILELWNQLSDEIKQDTVSTSRLYLRETYNTGQVVDWDLDNGIYEEKYSGL